MDAEKNLEMEFHTVDLSKVAATAPIGSVTQLTANELDDDQLLAFTADAQAKETKTKTTTTVKSVNNHVDRMANRNSEKVGYCLIMGNLIIISLLTWTTVFLCYKSIAVKVNLFSWHPSLMAVGYLIFMFHAILVMGENALWGNQLKYSTRITFHWVMQLIATTLISLAFTAIYVNKNLLGKQHFHTYHAIVGLVTLIATYVGIVGGVWARYSLKLRALMRPVVVKLIHSFLGVFIFNLAAVTIGLGLYSHWWEKVTTPTDESWMIIILVLAASVIFVSYRPLKVNTKRLRTLLRRSST